MDYQCGHQLSIEMTEIDNKINIERLNRLLADLQYELTRGLHQGYIKDELGGDVVLQDQAGEMWRFKFQLWKSPFANSYARIYDKPNRLQLVKNNHDK